MNPRQSENTLVVINAMFVNREASNPYFKLSSETIVDNWDSILSIVVRGKRVLIGLIITSLKNDLARSDWIMSFVRSIPL